MKYWTKVVVVGSVAFIIITAMTMFIAHSIGNSSHTLKERDDVDESKDRVRLNKNEPIPPEIQAKIDNAPYVPRGR